MYAAAGTGLHEVLHPSFAVRAVRASRADKSISLILKGFHVLLPEASGVLGRQV
jgi:hypothetical protein